MVINLHPKSLYTSWNYYHHQLVSEFVRPHALCSPRT